MSDTLSNAVRHPFWNDTVAPQPDCPSLTADVTCDLAIVGGGFTGLWTALQARRRQPQGRILLVEQGRCGDAASGRNGGFCAPSISHGVGNALKVVLVASASMVHRVGGREAQLSIVDQREIAGQRWDKYTMASEFFRS